MPFLNVLEKYLCYKKNLGQNSFWSRRYLRFSDLTALGHFGGFGVTPLGGRQKVKVGEAYNVTESVTALISFLRMILTPESKLATRHMSRHLEI